MAHIDDVVSAIRGVIAKLDEAANNAGTGEDRLSSLQDGTARLGADGLNSRIEAAQQDVKDLQAHLTLAKGQGEHIIAAALRILDGSYTAYSRPAPSHDNLAVTWPSFPPDCSRRARGTQHLVHHSNDDDRALRRENECADILARHGYMVEQSPGQVQRRLPRLSHRGTVLGLLLS